MRQEALGGSGSDGSAAFAETIEDRGSKIDPPFSILDPRSSIFDPRFMADSACEFC
jgi:hypothetical protein